MYEDVVKELRNLLRAYKATDNGDCHQAKILANAADAIEELIKGQKYLSEQVAKWQAEVVKGDCEAWLSEQDKPHWISVTELLPEESEGLRWCEELTLRFTSVWCCDVNTGTIEVRNRLQGKKTGIDGLDQYMKDEKWHWSHSWWEPTHWMPIVPLPESPKEENTDV